MTSGLKARLPTGDELHCDTWAEQPMWWSERYRCRALVWPAGEAWFANDPLGPMPHSHPGASEIYLLVSGKMEVTVGRETVLLEAGGKDFMFIPAGTYHAPQLVGDDHVCLLGAVAPNFRDCRAKYADFDDAEFQGMPRLAALATAVGDLPGDDRLVSEVIELGPGEKISTSRRPDADGLIYVLEGEASVSVEHLSGALRANDYVNLMAGQAHSLLNDGESNLRALMTWGIGRGSE